MWVFTKYLLLKLGRQKIGFWSPIRTFWSPGGPALRANMNLVNYIRQRSGDFQGRIRYTAHFLNGQNMSSRRSMCCKKRTDTCVEHHVRNKLQKLRRQEESDVLICPYSQTATETDIRLQRGYNKPQVLKSFHTGQKLCSTKTEETASPSIQVH